jgi:hypothetical protein
MLLGMMRRAQAHGPAIGRLQANAAVSPGANVGTFDRDIETRGHAAMMAPHPGPVAGALALAGELALPLDATGKPHSLRLHQDEVGRRLIADHRLVPANIGLAHSLRRAGRAGWSQQRLPPPGEAFPKGGIEIGPLATDGPQLWPLAQLDPINRLDALADAKRVHDVAGP